MLGHFTDALTDHPFLRMPAEIADELCVPRREADVVRAPALDHQAVADDAQALEASRSPNTSSHVSARSPGISNRPSGSVIAMCLDSRQPPRSGIADKYTRAPATGISAATTRPLVAGSRRSWCGHSSAAQPLDDSASSAAPHRWRARMDEAAAYPSDAQAGGLIFIGTPSVPSVPETGNDSYRFRHRSHTAKARIKSREQSRQTAADKDRDPLTRQKSGATLSAKDRGWISRPHLGQF